MHIRNTIQLATICAVAAALTACKTHETEQTSYSSQSSMTEASGSRSEARPSSDYQEVKTTRTTRTTHATSQVADQDEIVIPLHEEKLNVGKKTVETGQIRVRKVVTTETVSQPIQLRKESIVIERLPAGSQNAQQQPRSPSPSSGSAQAFQEQEMTITIREEQPVVEKQVVVGDQFIARKIPDTQQVNVQREIRREDIQLDRSGDTANVQITGFEPAGAERPQSQQQQQKDSEAQQPEGQNPEPKE
jgi:uncharacterized protein (TIGR02271 family)